VIGDFHLPLPPLLLLLLIELLHAACSVSSLSHLLRALKVEQRGLHSDGQKLTKKLPTKI